MKNPNIIFTSPGVAELIDKEIPVLRDEYDVLVKTAVTTISAGTERANLIGNPNVNGTGAPSVVFPRQAGYSTGGEVIAVGDKVTRVKVGDRVAVSWTKHAAYNVVNENQVYLLPDSVSYAEASLVHITTFPLAAIRKCHTEIGESAIVMGMGVLGIIATVLLRAAGASPIIAVDPVKEKRELALTLGADYAFDPFEPDFAKTVKGITNGGAKLAIEVTGLGQGLDMVLDCMAKFGRVALLGCTRSSDFTIDYYRKVHCPGITLIGAHTRARPAKESAENWWTEKDDAEAIINLVKTGRIDLKRLIEETYSPEDAPAVYDRLAKNSAFPIVQFDWTRLETSK